MAQARLEGGFADPVTEAQGTFRALMQALARPGKIQRFEVAVSPPSPLSPEIAAVALTLADHETPIWLGKPLAEREEVRRWLAFHTGAPVVEAPEEAIFAFADAPASLPPLSSFSRGTAEYPDTGATIVLGVPSLESGSRVELSGPGIETVAKFAPGGLPPAWWTELQATRRFFPLGIDILFASAGSVAGLPRSTRIEMMEAA